MDNNEIKENYLNKQKHIYTGETIIELYEILNIAKWSDNVNISYNPKPPRGKLYVPYDKVEEFTAKIGELYVFSGWHILKEKQAIN